MQTVVRGKRAMGTMLVVIALLATSAGACGDDDTGADAGGGADENSARLNSAAPKVRPVVPPAPPSRRKASPRWSTDDWGDSMYANAEGVLVKPDGGEIRGWGDRRVRRYVTALFARMQYDFLTGDMASVCKHADSALSTLVTGAPDGASCETTLDRFAQKLEKRGFKATPLRFLWVRTYPGVAGIWVENRSGERFRVPFVQEGDDGWLLQLDEVLPEAIAMPLRGEQP